MFSVRICEAGRSRTRRAKGQSNETSGFSCHNSEINFKLFQGSYLFLLGILSLLS